MTGGRFGSTIEPALWLAHGVVLGLLNLVWITASHIMFLDQYPGRQAREDMMKSMPAAIAGKLIKSGPPSVQRI